MSDLTCWNCKKAVSFYERRENDGDCPHCNHYIDLETVIDDLRKYIEQLESDIKEYEDAQPPL